MDIDIVCRDFNVMPICTVTSATLCAGVDDVHHHFVFSGEDQGISRLEQTHVHRYELANILFGKPESGRESLTLSNGHRISVNGNGLANSAYKWKNPEMTFLLDQQNSRFHDLIKEDINRINKIRTSFHADPKYRSKVVKQLNGKVEFNHETTSTLTDREIELIAFELDILKESKRLKKATGAFEAYRVLLGDELNLSAKMKESFLQKFEYIIYTQSCDCGSPGCFFDILKSNQLHFFNQAALGDGIELDVSTGLDHFEKMWEDFSPYQKTTLLFLDEKFGNTPWLNLAFLRPDFDLGNYQYLMCFQEQPDSDEEKDVRLVSSVGNYFLQKQVMTI